MKNIGWIGIVALVNLVACTNTGTHSADSNNIKSHYKIANTFKVAGDGGWDLLTVDEQAGRVFLSHSDVVQVVDEKNGSLLGSMPAAGVHGIALATDLNKGFFTNGKDSSVTVFDTKTLQVLTKVPVTGQNPDAIIYEPTTHRIFAFNGHSSNATVIDANENKVVGTIALDGKPELPAVDGAGKVYVNLEDKSEVTEIDAVNLKVLNTWSIAPGEEPSGLALDTKNHFLFMACSNGKMVVMNALDGKIATTLPIGEDPDGAAFDPELKRAYSSSREGTLTVVQEDSNGTFKVLENVPTQKGARTIAVDTKTHHLYLPTAEFGDTPAPTEEHPHPRPAIKPGTFVLLDVVPLD